MVAVTYGATRAPAAEANARAQGDASDKNIFTRVIEAMMESRLQQAHREIARHAHFLSRAP